MESPDVLRMLREAGIQPSAQRLAVGAFVLDTCSHPSADQVLAAVKPSQPSLSRATVYNTLHLFAQRGLLQELLIAEGRVVFDPKIDPHHHFVDDDTGEIADVAFDAVDVVQKNIDGLDVRDVQVVLRGRRL
jgi:Fe2+ or Zn2+ uptake regulation protein